MEYQPIINRQEILRVILGVTVTAQHLDLAAVHIADAELKPEIAPYYGEIQLISTHP